MKKILFSICILFSSVFSYCQLQDSLLVIVLMVKNEEEAVIKTLQPFVDAGVDSLLVFDTGSTDNTIEVTKKFFQENPQLKGIIEQEPFIDFATSRNHALDTAQKAFPHASFMIMPDAEWYMQNVSDLLTFCREHQHDNESAYLVRIVMESNLDFYTARLIRCGSNVYFKGAVHEALNYCARIQAPKNSCFKMVSTRYGIEKTRKRWLRDKEILLKEFEKNPHDPRTVFYLAQTHACLGDWENAIVWYKVRAEMPGWDEENFITHYRMAQAYDALNNWTLAAQEYLEAFSLRPSRAEPLVQLSRHYWDTNQIDLCYLFARRAAELAYPEKDILFIEKELYEFTRHDLLGRAAWYVGDYELGENAVRKAIERHPEYEYLRSNLECYTTIKNKILIQ